MTQSMTHYDDGNSRAWGIMAKETAIHEALERSIVIGVFKRLQDFYGVDRITATSDFGSAGSGFESLPARHAREV